MRSTADLSADLKGVAQHSSLPSSPDATWVDETGEGLLLQVVSAVNAGVPAHGATSSTATRLLRLQLTDGHSQCGAFEYKPLGTLDAARTTPGAKLLVTTGARFVGGMLLLEPERCQFLGGRVEALAAAWEQRVARAEGGAAVYAAVWRAAGRARSPGRGSRAAPRPSAASSLWWRARWRRRHWRRWYCGRCWRRRGLWGLGRRWRRWRRRVG